MYIYMGVCVCVCVCVCVFVCVCVVYSVQQWLEPEATTSRGPKADICKRSVYRSIISIYTYTHTNILHLYV